MTTSGLNNCFIFITNDSDISQVFNALPEEIKLSPTFFAQYLIESTQNESDVQATCAYEGHSLDPAYVTSSDRLAELVYKAKEFVDNLKQMDVTVNVWLTASNVDLLAAQEVLSILFSNQYTIKLRVSDRILDIPHYVDSETDTYKQVKNYLSSAKITNNNLDILHSPAITNDIFYHGFTTRTGGVSTHPGCRSLNMSNSQDTKIIVDENRRRLASTANFKLDNFVIAKANHGNTVWLADLPEPKGGYDGIITNKCAYTIAAPGADCNIVLFADSKLGVCGTAHAGWKGVLAGIIEEMMRSLTQHFNCQPNNIHVALGPSLAPCCFEIGEDVAKPFETKYGKSIVIHDKCWNKPHLNLQQAIRLELEKWGVPSLNIDDSTCTICTKCHPDKFFSFRSSGKPFGNQIGFIGIKPH